jgi:F-box/WD-40 domain protein MET30
VFEGHVGQVQQLQLMPPEFELDHDSFLAGDKDDDTSSVGSVAHHHHDESQQTIPFWSNDSERAAPPRYMFTGALDSTIRLWDTHQPHAQSQQQQQQAQQQQHQQPAEDTSNSFIVLPTDPLTNSHTPRAQACIRTFFGHVEGIWALAADHLRLISGSEDRMMKVWDPRTGKCERTFTGHAGPVTCAWLSESRLASGSEDCEVRMLVFGDQC